jgi:hypothetical protein
LVDAAKGIVTMIENRGAKVVCGVAFLFASIALPEAAQAGFFEQLFGVQPAPPSYYGEGDSPERPSVRSRSHRDRRVESDKPVLQKTTDIMHDPTLRDGDAVMTASGIEIFVGRRGDVHDQDDFVPLGEAQHLKRNARIELASLNTAHDETPAKTALPVIGRSAYVASAAVSAGNDAHAHRRTVRFVGP